MEYPIKIIRRKFFSNASYGIKLVLLASLTLSGSPPGSDDPPVQRSEGKTNAERLGFPAGTKVLLLHMDDLGMCPEANIAGENYIRKGRVRSGAVMMPCPSAEDFISRVKKYRKADIGVHLTLTSEWKTYRWGPVADPGQVKSLLEAGGTFYHDVPEVVIHATPGDVEKEIRAQIDKMISLGRTPTHIDTHMGTLYGSAEYLSVFLKTARDYHIPANAIDLSNPGVAEYYRKAGYPIDDRVIGLINDYPLPKLDNFTSVPDGKTYESKRDSFLALISALPAGLTEIIFHPSVETENLKSITGSWQQRAWEARLFEDPVVIRYLKENGIILTTWKEIMKKFNAKERK